MTTRRRVELQVAVVRQGVPSYQIAAKANLHPTRLSAIVHGRATPSPSERQRIAAALDVAESDIFGEDCVVAVLTPDTAKAGGNPAFASTCRQTNTTPHDVEVPVSDAKLPKRPSEPADPPLTGPLAALLLTRAYLGVQRLRRDQLASEDADAIEHDLLRVFDFLRDSWREPLQRRRLVDLFDGLDQPPESGQT